MVEKVAAPAPAAPKGLQNVVVGQSKLSLVNGAEGKLIYAGYKIEDLAEHSTFEEVVYLLWHLKLPNKTQLEELRKAINAQMPLSPEIIALMKMLPKQATPMAVLRTVVSALSLYDPKADDNSVEENRRKALLLTAKTATIAAAWERIRTDKEVIAPRPDLHFAANFLLQLFCPQQVFQLRHELLDVLEIQINRCKAHIGHFVVAA